MHKHPRNKTKTKQTNNRNGRKNTKRSPRNPKQSRTKRRIPIPTHIQTTKRRTKIQIQNSKTNRKNTQFWILDEFAATLDRDTAKIVAFNMQKIARQKEKQS